LNGNYRNDGKERVIFICSLFFLAGGIIGGVSGSLLSQSTSLIIRDGLKALLAGEQASLTKILLDNFALPLIALFLATSVIGWLLAPTVTIIKGYVLGWVVSSALETTTAGIDLYIYYGLPALITVPCLIYITASSIKISKSVSDVISQRRRSMPDNSLTANGGGRPTAVCLALLLLVSLAQAYLMPSLVQMF
jgi:hypothetical protein